MHGNGPLPCISRKHIKNAPVGRRAPLGRQRVQHSMYSRPARREESVKEVLKREYPRGVDLVYESVGGDMFEVRLAVEAVWGGEGLFAVLWCGGWTAGSGRVGAAAIMSNRREGSVCWVPGRSMPATPLLTLAAAHASAVATDLPQRAGGGRAAGGHRSHEPVPVRVAAQRAPGREREAADEVGLCHWWVGSLLPAARPVQQVAAAVVLRAGPRLPCRQSSSMSRGEVPSVHIAPGCVLLEGHPNNAARLRCRQVVPALKALSCPRLCSPPLLPQASSSSSTPASSGATCASWRACGRRASCAWNWTPTALWACRPCRTRWSCCTRAVAAARWWCSCRRTCRRRRPSCEGWAGCREGE